MLQSTSHAWWSEVLQNILAKSIGDLISPRAAMLFRAVKSLFGRSSPEAAQALRDVQRAKSSSGWQREGRGIWVIDPISPPKIESNPHIPSAKILVVANAKGGVGKTTVSANLGARFAEFAKANGKKPVLLIKTPGTAAKHSTRRRSSNDYRGEASLRP